MCQKCSTSWQWICSEFELNVFRIFAYLAHTHTQCLRNIWVGELATNPFFWLRPKKHEVCSRKKHWEWSGNVYCNVPLCEQKLRECRVHIRSRSPISRVHTIIDSRVQTIRNPRVQTNPFPTKAAENNAKARKGKDMKKQAKSKEKYWI